MTTTLLVGGTIGRPGRPGRPADTAMVVAGDRIAWLGAQQDADASDVDLVVQLDGGHVTAAFVDAHVHSTATGLALTGLDLTAAASLGAALDQVERHARERRGLGIMLGHGWDETTWPERRPPTRLELDRASYGSAVYLTRIDVHSAVASSALLAAVAAARPDLPGLPGWSESGPLTRDAHHAVRTLALASVTPAQRAGAQRATLDRCAELGIAAVHEMGGPHLSSAEDFASILELGQGPGPMVFGYWGELGGVERARELGALGAAGDLFADGALGSHTAYLRAVYADTDGCGFAYLGAGQVRDHVVACSAAGIQAGFHVIGDAALDVVVAGFTAAADRVGVEAVRAGGHRLEHVEMPDAGHLAALARLGVHASVQPVFDALWGGADDMYAARLGRQRAQAMNPFAAMASAGLTLAFGSDSPVTGLGPWHAVRAAVNHRTPQSALPVQAAFDAHTAGGWQAAGVLGEGRLEPGAPASYAVWDGEADLSAAGAGTAPQCLRTTVRGRTIWTRQGALA